MSGGEIAALVIVIVLVIAVIAAIAFVRARARRERLRSAFGPEYDAAVEQHGSQTRAQRELEERQRRHDQLGTRPLSQDSRAKYVAAWSDVQASFVDRPNHAVTEADELIKSVMLERGYPVESYDQMTADLSVEHAEAMSAYRRAHDLSFAASPSTEDLRSAMLSYRRLFSELVESPDGAAQDSVAQDSVGQESVRTQRGTTPPA